MTSPRHLGVARALSTLLVIALVLSACGGDTADNKPVDLSDSTQVNVVALFDRSGSTATKSPGNGRRVGIERAIWPAVFFPNLGRGYSLKVLPIGFASDAKAWCEWPDGPTGSEQAMSQDPGCRTQLENILPKPVEGFTFFDKALALDPYGVLSSFYRYLSLHARSVLTRIYHALGEDSKRIGN
jgi:hypothetical protein